VRHHLGEEETRVEVVGGIVFEGAVVAGERVFIQLGHDAGIHEEPDRHRHVAGVDEIVEGDRDVVEVT
jgi:hypothetical protein